MFAMVIAAVLLLPQQSDRIECLAYSPNGTLIAVGGDKGEVAVVTSLALNQGHLLQGHTGPVRALAFLGNDHLVTGGGPDGQPGELFVWDLATGKHQALNDGPPEPIRLLAVASDGTSIAAAGMTLKEAFIWSRASKDADWKRTGIALDTDKIRITGDELPAALLFIETRLWVPTNHSLEVKLARMKAEEKPKHLLAVARGRLVSAFDHSGALFDRRGMARPYQPINSMAVSFFAGQRDLVVADRKTFQRERNTLRLIQLVEQSDVREALFTADRVVFRREDGIIFHAKQWDGPFREVQLPAGVQPVNVGDIALSPDGTTLAIACGSALYEVSLSN